MDLPDHFGCCTIASQINYQMNRTRVDCNSQLKEGHYNRQMKAKPGESTEGQDHYIKTEINPSLNSETSDTTLKVHPSKR